MKILFLSDSYPDHKSPMNGIFVRHQLEAISSFGLKVDLINVKLLSIKPSKLKNSLLSLLNKVKYSNHLDSAEILSQCLNIPIVAPSIWIRKVETLFNEYVKVYGKPNIIHAHGSLLAGEAAQHIKTKYNIPYVITEHFSKFTNQKLSVKALNRASQAYKQADHIISVSQFLSNHINPLTGSTQMTVIPNLVDTDFFIPKTLQKDSEYFEICCIGNLVPIKRIDNVINAFNILSEEYDKVRLHIIGQGPELKRLKEISCNNKAPGKVVFHGYKNSEGVRNILQNSNLLVSASTIETFGITIIEALSCGIPVLATKSGGPNEIIQNNDYGQLVEIDDVYTMAKMMKDFYIHKNKWLLNKDNIRRYAIENYDINIIAPKIIDIYKKLSSEINK